MATREFLFGSIFLLANKLQTLGDNVLEEITLKQWFLLIMMQNMESQEPSVTEIADFIGSSRQNVRKMLETLAAKGYVTLTVNEQDKRNLSVSLSEKALHFFAQFEAKGHAFLDELFQGISPELQAHTRTTFELFFTNLEGMKSHYGKNGHHL